MPGLQAWKIVAVEATILSNSHAPLFNMSSLNPFCEPCTSKRETLPQSRPTGNPHRLLHLPKDMAMR